MNVTVKPPRTAAETALIERFAAQAGSLPGNAAVTRARDAAIAMIGEGGLPTRRAERWHYTDMRALLRVLPDAGERPAEAGTMSDGAVAVVIEDSVVHLPENIPGHVSIAPFERDLAEGRGLDAMIAPDDAVGQINTGFVAGGCRILIGANGDEMTVIELTDLTGAGSHLRHDIAVAAGARALLIDHQRGHGFSSSIGSVTVGDGAEVTWLRVQERAEDSVDLSRLQAKIGTEGRLLVAVLNAGGKLIRQDINIAITGENADFRLRAVNLVGGEQHVDITMQVDHQVPNTTSTELVRNVVTGRGQGVFQGQIKVADVAQKTDARMACNTLLLSDEAGFSTKPELEIFADDVACGHGATVAEINHDHLFYLMARGIPEAQARALLIKAFVAELIEDIDDETIVDLLEARLDPWFERH